MDAAGEITVLLERMSAGDRSAEEELLPRVYDELRRLAASYLRRERLDHTLQATALVHEAYLKLTGRTDIWKGRVHFFALAAQVMRHVLVDHARKSMTAKRGGGAPVFPLNENLRVDGHSDEWVIDLDDALTRLTEIAPHLARVVELRFFGGMTEEAIAERLGVSSRTVKRQWMTAKAWLHAELTR